MYTQYLGHTKATFNLMYMHLLATMDELKHKFAPVIIAIKLEEPRKRKSLSDFIPEVSIW